ncbi:MAG: xylan 1,4-beta-xylosidase [Oscillospiraceae bacterium]|nr:xylan 1,4-beta-xylosidase [Oscillospiraceae bacterium]
MAEKRFVKTHVEGGIVTVSEIWVDRETGVNYFFHHSGNAAGLTPLLDRDGKPVVSALPIREEA